MDLEQEFEQYKALHKYAVLKATIIRYFMDLEDNQINLPDWLRETPEQKADKEIKRLIMKNDNLQEFNELYEKAYNKIAIYIN